MHQAMGIAKPKMLRLDPIWAEGSCYLIFEITKDQSYDSYLTTRLSRDLLVDQHVERYRLVCHESIKRYNLPWAPFPLLLPFFYSEDIVNPPWTNQAMQRERGRSLCVLACNTNAIWSCVSSKAQQIRQSEQGPERAKVMALEWSRSNQASSHAAALLEQV